jgi:multiple sugar transport system permease protein
MAETVLSRPESRETETRFEAPKRRRFGRRGHPDAKLPYLLLAPTIIFTLVVTMPPFVYAVWISLERWQLTRPDLERKFIGLDNYRQIMHSADFGTAFWHSILYTCVSVLAAFLIGFGLALLLNATRRGRGLYTTLLLLPMVTTPVVIGLLFKYLYNYDYGIINYALSLLGLHRVAFLGDPAWALWSVIAVETWQWTPFVALVLLAGLDGLPRAPFEAASVDGASRLQVFRWVTLPQMKKVILIVVLIRAMDAFRSFDLLFMMTKGGPGNATETLSVESWRQAFSFFNMGIGAALALFMFYIVLTVSWGFMQAAGIGKRTKAA